MTALHSLNHLGIAAQRQAHQGHQLQALLLVAGRLGQHHHIAMIADRLEILQGNRVGHATVKQLSALHLDHLGGQRHGCRGTNPVVGVERCLGKQLIDRLARQHIGTNHIERHGVRVEGVVVEDIQLLRHPAIAKLGIEIIACGEPRPDATIAAVTCEACIISDSTSGLSRLVVTTKSRTCRHANKAVGPNVVLHHHIGHARRPQASHSATFKYQSSFLSIHNSANI